MKYSIIVPYFDRFRQLRNTLASFRYHYGERRDYEVIVMEDGKNAINDSLRVEDLCVNFNRIAPIIHLKRHNPGYNPALLFNKAAGAASGEFLVLTNPECIHFNDVLGVLDDEFKRDPEQYVVCSCLAVKDFDNEFTTPDKFKYKKYMWYQHSEHRNAQYHFCSAMSVVNYRGVGGFDEQYADGIGYDDDAFRLAVIRCGLKVLSCDRALTLHQDHKKLHHTIPRGEYHRRLNKNKALFEAQESAR